MSTRARGRKTSTSKGVPAYSINEQLAEDAIKDLLTRTEHVHLRIQRRNSKGLFSNVTSLNKPTKELYTLEEYLRKLAGGGDFEVDVRDPNDPTVRFFRLKIFLEGAAHPPRIHGSAAEQFIGPGDGFVPPPSKFELGLSPEQRKGYKMDRQRRYGAPVATMASDELALKQIGDLQAEKARLEAETRALTEKLEATHRESQRETATLREELMRIRSEMVAKEQESKFELLQQEIRSMREAKASAPAAPAVDYVGLASAFAPVAAAFIASRTESSSAALQLQAQGMQNLMDATLRQADKESPMEKLTAQLIALGPVVAPFIQQFLSKNDPEKQAAIYDSMAANNLNSIAMMAQLVESFAAATAGEEDKWWVAVIKEALGGVVQATERYMQTPGGLPGQRPALPAAQPQGPYTTVVDHAPPAKEATVEAVETDRTVPNALRVLVPMLPAAYQTPEWVSGLEQLHAEPPLEIEEVATWWAGFLEKLIEDKTLPAELAAIHEKPRAALYGLVEQLPAAKTRQTWLVETIERLIAMLVEDGYIKQEALDAELAASQQQQQHQEVVKQAVG